jgi:hypothetical protein
MNRTLVELARAMIIAQELPEFLWEPAVAHAAYLRNRACTKPLKDITPYERWTKKKPDVSHLREFGAPVWVLLQGQHVQRKLLPKSKRRIYVGFDDGSQSVKYYVAETRKILISRNYRFLNLREEDTRSEDGTIVVAPDVPREGESEGGTQPTGTPTGTPKENQSDSLKRKRNEGKEPLDLDDPQKKLQKVQDSRPDHRYLYNPFPDEDDDELRLTSAETFAAAAAAMPYGGDEPSLDEAKRSPEWPEWERAMQTELDQLRDMKTWILVKRPADAVPISNKWVFLKKYSKDGELLKYKGRLVAKGCAQRPGHDYTETFSPVVRLETIRAILAIAPKERLKIQQMDVKGAYLNGVLNERVYMRQPEGYDDGTGRVCLLQKTLYGLKQSGREWNKEFDGKLKKFGFNRLCSDPCSYRRRDETGHTEIITVWVDDLLLFASSTERMNITKDELRSVWEVTDLGEPAKIVGIEIEIKDDSITISQRKYIEDILKREGMDQANDVGMPMDPNVKLQPNPDTNEPNRSNSFARLLGELQYLANRTRPDITFAVNRLGAYTANPSMQHVGALKRVLRYLVGTKNHGITYTASPTTHEDATTHNTMQMTHKGAETTHNDANLFYGYADAAYANVDDYKSTSGYVFLVGNGAITWSSKKQTTIALSSTEAEYVALAEAGREACWLRNLYDELGYTQAAPSLIMGDNDGSIAMARNPQFHKRSKHIATRWHWVRELVEHDVVTVESCRDPEQTADILTKPLPRPKHQKHTKEMGVVPT